MKYLWPAVWSASLATGFCLTYWRGGASRQDEHPASPAVAQASAASQGQEEPPAVFTAAPQPPQLAVKESGKGKDKKKGKDKNTPPGWYSDMTAARAQARKVGAPLFVVFQ